MNMLLYSLIYRSSSLRQRNHIYGIQGYHLRVQPLSATLQTRQTSAKDGEKMSAALVADTQLTLRLTDRHYSSNQRDLSLPISGANLKKPVCST
jgi:hypothetical protein